MFNRSRLHLSFLTKKRALSSVLLLVLVGIVVSIAAYGPISLSNPVKKTYHFTNIPNIDRIFSSVGTFVPTDNGKRSRVQSAILPHHTEIGSTIDRFWSELADSSAPDVIVIVSPAHWDQGNGSVQTTHAQWETPFGMVRTDDQLVETLIQKAHVTLEPDSFENEHGISVQTPYVAHYFPNTLIVPVIAQSGAGQTAAQELVNVLAQQDKRILFVASIDFSHYLPEDASLQNDEETWQAMVDHDYARIDQFGSEHIDSSFALDTYLFWQSYTGCLSSERWHGFHPAGTSYQIHFCTEAPVLRVTAVGDVMLDRGVANQLFVSRLANSVSLLTHVAKGSDMVFGNLESVISDQGESMNKLYVFRAAPSSVRVLQSFGFTHVSVANNHTEDYGLSAWEQSVEILKNSQIVPIGDFHNEPQVQTFQKGDQAVALLAFQNLTFPLNEDVMLMAIRNANQSNDYVIVSMHWGEEYQPVPNPQTVSLAHTMIDAGADVILGHHPHVLQPVETYHDGLIFYSLGNFVFDQEGIAQNTSEITTIDFYKDEPPSYQLIPVQIKNFLPRHVSFQK